MLGHAALDPDPNCLKYTIKFMINYKTIWVGRNWNILYSETVSVRKRSFHSLPLYAPITPSGGSGVKPQISSAATLRICLDSQIHLGHESNQ